MNVGLTGQPGRRKRRRKTLLPTSAVVLDSISLLLLALLPVVVIWVLGGNRLWIMGPAILVVLLTGVLFAIRFFLSQTSYGIAVPPGGFCLLAFVGYLALMIPFAEISYEAWVELFRFISYAAAYWMWYNLLRFNHRWKWVMSALLMSVSIMAWYALIQHVHETNMVLTIERPSQYGMRASGAYICPNHFANLLAMMIPVSIGIAFSRKVGVPLRLVAGYTAVVCLPALFLTQSRSGYIGLFVGCIVLALTLALRKGAKRFFVVLLSAPVLAAVIGAAVWAVSPMVQGRVESAMRGDPRIGIWTDSMAMVEDTPVFGSGLGSYRWKFPFFRETFTSNTNPEFAHNEYLHFWIETGIVGLGLFGLAAFAIIRRGIRKVRDRDSESAYLVAGCLGALIGAYAHAFFDFNFHIFGSVHVLVLLVAALMAATYTSPLDRERILPHRTAKIVGIAVCLLLAGLSIAYARSLGSYFFTSSADAHVAKLNWDQGQRAFETAIKWDRSNWKAHVGLAHLLRTRSFWSRNAETKANWLEQSKEIYKQVESMNPWEGDVLLGLGAISKIEGDNEEALRYLQLAVDKVPRQVFYLNELGLQLKRMNRYEEALEVFQESRSIEFTSVARANILWLQKKIAAR